MPWVSKFYLHTAANQYGGAIPPGASRLSSRAVSFTSTNASTRSAMNEYAGGEAESGNQIAGTNTGINAVWGWFARFLSDPLDDQTISGTAIYNGVISSSSGSTYHAAGIYIGVWNPTAGSVTGVLYDTATDFWTSSGTGDTAGTSGPLVLSTVTCNQSDYLVVELYGDVKGSSATWTQSWAGTTGSSISFSGPGIRVNRSATMLTTTLTTSSPTTSAQLIAPATPAPDIGDVLIVGAKATAGTVVVNDTASNTYTQIGTSGLFWAVCQSVPSDVTVGNGGVSANYAIIVATFRQALALGASGSSSSSGTSTSFSSGSATVPSLVWAFGNVVGTFTASGSPPTLSGIDPSWATATLAQSSDTHHGDLNAYVYLTWTNAQVAVSSLAYSGSLSASVAWASGIVLIPTLQPIVGPVELTQAMARTAL